MAVHLTYCWRGICHTSSSTTTYSYVPIYHSPTGVTCPPTRTRNQFLRMIRDSSLKYLACNNYKSWMCCNTMYCDTIYCLPTIGCRGDFVFIMRHATVAVFSGRRNNGSRWRQPKQRISSKYTLHYSFLVYHNEASDESRYHLLFCRVLRKHPTSYNTTRGETRFIVPSSSIVLH